MRTDPQRRAKGTRARGLAVVGPSGVGKSTFVPGEIRRALPKAVVLTTETVQDLDDHAWKACLHALTHRRDRCVVFLDDAAACVRQSALDVLAAFLASPRGWRVPVVVTDHRTSGRWRRQFYRAFAVVRLYRPYAADVVRFVAGPLGLAQGYARRIAATSGGDMRQVMRLAGEYRRRGNSGTDHPPARDWGPYDWARHTFDATPPRWDERADMPLLNDLLFHNYPRMYGDDGYYGEYSGLTRSSDALRTAADVAEAFSAGDLLGAAHAVNLPYLTIKTIRDRRCLGAKKVESADRPRRRPLGSLVRKLCGLRVPAIDAGLCIRTFQRRLQSLAPAERRRAVRNLDSNDMDALGDWRGLRVTRLASAATAFAS